MKNLREKNIVLVKEKLKHLNTEEKEIINLVRLILELEKTIDRFLSRLKSWYFYHDVFEEDVFDIVLKDKKNTAINAFAKEIKALIKLKEKEEKILEKKVKKNCLNLEKVCGGFLAAKLINEAKSLKALAFMPSSKIQVLGAEKALFKALKHKTKAPKHGIIFFHSSVFNAENKGKAARQLASKIAIAARKDFF